MDLNTDRHGKALGCSHCGNPRPSMWYPNGYALCDACIDDTDDPRFDRMIKKEVRGFKRAVAKKEREDRVNRYAGLIRRIANRYQD